MKIDDIQKAYDSAARLNRVTEFRNTLCGGKCSGPSLIVRVDKGIVEIQLDEQEAFWVLDQVAHTELETLKGLGAEV